ncbi:MAG: PEGA domain protein [Methanoregula sp. PtaU1.Bin051]|nr:MAG: PEGA domain protein [Methanoregula sp. PtaU1.Bin051]
MSTTSYTSLLITGFFFACLISLTVPAAAFTAQSLTITVDKDGDASAVFRYLLEGPVENAIPESMLQEELVKGLATSSEPPEVVTFDRSGAMLLMKKFAQVSETDTGTEYLTASMDFSRAQIALKESALSYIISADFSPQTTTVIFPDGYQREFADSPTLPSIRHTVIDPAKQAGSAEATGTVRVTSSPSKARILLDSVYIGNSPGYFTEIAPGEHTVTLELEGYLSTSRKVIVEGGRNTTVSVVLSYDESAVPADAGHGPGVPGFTAILAGLSIAAALAYQNTRR